MNQIKIKNSSLNDSIVGNIIHTKDAKNSIDDVYDCSSEEGITPDTEHDCVHKFIQ